MTKNTNTPTPLTDSPINKILGEIIELYPSFKAYERKKETAKEALKHQYECLSEEEDIERLSILGMRLHYKKKADYTWKKEALNEELEDTGGLYLLAKSKKIDKHVRGFIHVLVENEKGEMVPTELSHFAQEAIPYVRPYPKGNRKKKKDANQDEQTPEESYFDQLKDLTIEEVVTAYKLDKMDFEEAKNRYEDLKVQLLKAMLDEDVASIQTEMGKFSILFKEPQYDAYALLGHRFIKQLAYHLVTIDGITHITDLFSKESCITNDEPLTLDEHHLFLSNGRLEVDGQCLFLDRQDDGSYLAMGTMEIDSERLLRQLPFSTQNIEKLIDKGLLHPKTLERFRYVATVDDLNVHFEVIEEDTHNARIEMFMQRQSRRSERLRIMQEEAREVLHVL